MGKKTKALNWLDDKIKAIHLNNFLIKETQILEWAVNNDFSDVMIKRFIDRKVEKGEIDIVEGFIRVIK